MEMLLLNKTVFAEEQWRERGYRRLVVMADNSHMMNSYFDHTLFSCQRKQRNISHYFNMIKYFYTSFKIYFSGIF